MSESLENKEVNKTETENIKEQNNLVEGALENKDYEEWELIKEEKEKNRIFDSEVKNLEIEQQEKIDNLNKTIGLSEDKLEEIKQSFGLKEKLENITEKARNLAEEMKAKLKMAVVIGMSATALAGAGEFNKTEYGGIKSDSTKTEKLLTTKNNESDLNPAIFYTEDDLPRHVDVEKIKKHTKNEVENIRQKMEKHIESKAYYDKLKREYSDTSPRYRWERNLASKLTSWFNTGSMQKRRIDNLETAKSNILSDNEMQKRYKKHRFGNEGAVPKNFPGVGGFYNLHEHEINIASDNTDNETIRHEFGHATTKSNYDISEKAIRVLNDSYNKLNNKDEFYNDSYFSNPTERLVRKWEVDKEMERLGIKKYEEQFTKKHYEKLMKNYNKRKLSQDAEEFIRTTKPEFEHFEKIFNEIAKNEEADKFLNA